MHHSPEILNCILRTSHGPFGVSKRCAACFASQLVYLDVKARAAGLDFPQSAQRVQRTPLSRSDYIIHNEYFGGLIETPKPMPMAPSGGHLKSIVHSISINFIRQVMINYQLLTPSTILTHYPITLKFSFIKLEFVLILMLWARFASHSSRYRALSALSTIYAAHTSCTSICFLRQVFSSFGHPIVARRRFIFSTLYRR